MNNKMHKVLLIASVLALTPYWSANALAESDAHEAHDHGEHSDEHGEEEHDDHDDEGHEETGHSEEEGHDNHDEEEEVRVELSAESSALAKIVVRQITPSNLQYSEYAPAEVHANGYTRYVVSPKIESNIVQRHVALGDTIKIGQPLVTLFSEFVAEAQGEYLVANAEWLRVTTLGRKNVGDSRYLSAKATWQSSKSKLLAYGLQKVDIERLTPESTGLGEYTLQANAEGVVLSDDFHQGQRVSSGESLIVIAEESTVWVEASLPPNSTLVLPVGSLARIKSGDQWFDGNVIQAAHTIDERTRTRIVRLLVNNTEHRLHPGQFADVYFSQKTKDPILAVPESALMRGSDGDWVVYVEEESEEAGHHAYRPQEIEVGRSLGGLREIRGIAAGTRVVTEGAFFVSSEIAKGGFDPHNH